MSQADQEEYSTIIVWFLITTSHLFGSKAREQELQIGHSGLMGLSYPELVKYNLNTKTYVEIHDEIVRVLAGAAGELAVEWTKCVSWSNGKPPLRRDLLVSNQNSMGQVDCMEKEVKELVFANEVHISVKIVFEKMGTMKKAWRDAKMVQACSG
ncbi:hypothetical protein EV426DRAFT_573979 [Tirmania nivea]|nr:hypothetical protein EV426DRAFT_573979 [Tirmania nivea]